MIKSLNRYLIQPIGYQRCIPWIDVVKPGPSPRQRDRPFHRHRFPYKQSDAHGPPGANNLYSTPEKLPVSLNPSARIANRLAVCKSSWPRCTKWRPSSIARRQWSLTMSWQWYSAHEAFWNSGRRLAQRRLIICVTVSGRSQT